MPTTRSSWNSWCPGGQAVFGIEVYLMDPQGKSAFSFLLNSHHQMCAEAKLFARSSSEAARTNIIEEATRIGLLALTVQITQAHGRIAAAQADASSNADGGRHGPGRRCQPLSN